MLCFKPSSTNDVPELGQPEHEMHNLKDESATAMFKTASHETERLAARPKRRFSPCTRICGVVVNCVPPIISQNAYG